MNIAAIYPIKPLYDDPNVSLIMDGDVVFAYEERKLSRKRRDLSGQGYPAIALHAALKRAGLRPDEIELWALVGTADDVHADFIALLRQTGLIHFVPDLKFSRVPHHLAHAALAVFSSPFDECLYISMDHANQHGYSAMSGAFRHNHFQEIHGFTGGHLSNFWSDMAHYLGFRQFEEEKLTGLAAYGHVDENLYRHFRSIVHISADGLGIVYRQPRRIMQQDLDSFDCDEFSLFSTHARFDLSSIPYIREVSKPDIASTVQQLVEDYVSEIVSGLVKKTGMRQVALCGSLFQNSRLNGVLVELLGGDAVHVPMAPGDDGLSLGAALYTFWEKSGRRCRSIPLSPYLGPIFDNKTIEQDIKAFGLKYRNSSEVAKETAELIAQGKVAGWFQGAGEYGPRSLGARSVLADPRKPHTRERLNGLLKNPHWFVPYAPSILEEQVDEFFHNGCKSPYMNMSFRAREEKERLFPAAVHADGTCMPQTVCKSQNKRFYEVIEEFKRITGVPLVLNTGFHLFGVPAVCTPRQALEHLCMGCVDVLVIGDYIVEREFVPKEEQLPPGSESHLVASLRAMPVVDLALAGKTRKAMEICGRLGIPWDNGIDALISTLSNEPDRKDLAERLKEQLTDLIEASEKQKVRSLEVEKIRRGAETPVTSLSKTRAFS